MLGLRCVDVGVLPHDGFALIVVTGDEAADGGEGLRSHDYLDHFETD